MENSILRSTKLTLGLAVDYTPFDVELITHINSALGVVNQLGVGLAGGLTIDDDTALWSDLATSTPVLLSLARNYVTAKVKMLFDPPPNKFHLQAYKDQIEELEWRLHAAAELTDVTQTVSVTEPVRPVPPNPYDTEEDDWWQDEPMLP